MKKVLIPVASMITVLLACSSVVPGPPKEEVRHLDAFSGIGISVSADVYYTPGNTHEIRAFRGDRPIFRKKSTSTYNKR